MHPRPYGRAPNALGSVEGMGTPVSRAESDWLEETLHYLVDTVEGPVGVLEGYELDEHGSPERIVVAQGWFGRRHLSIPLDSVVTVDHGARRLVVTAGAAPLQRGLLRLLEAPRRRPRRQRAVPASRQPAA